MPTTGAIAAPADRTAGRSAGLEPAGRSRGPWIGLGVAVVLVTAAIATPTLFSWDVHVARFPPLLADWRPQVGPGTLPAIAVGALTIAFGVRFAERSRWWLLLLVVFLAAVAWALSLATVDGLHGLDKTLGSRTQYLPTARQVTDIGATLRTFIDHIPLTAHPHWTVNVGGHPPGALLVFVLLVRIGLGGSLAAGVTTVVLASTAPVAVLICLRRLGAEAVARRAAPFLAVGPAAIWVAVTADALFAAPAAWGLCCLAIGATGRTRAVRIAGSTAAGLLLGCCVFLSYGLPLLGLLAVAVLVAARSWRPLPVAVGAALVVAIGFAAAGFAWWEAYPVLIRRYWAGIAHLRPPLYWIWADLAVLALSAGPAVAAGIGAAFSRVRDLRRPGPPATAVLLALAGLAIVLVADVSGLSKSEVERIWQPFLPWLLVGTALLTLRWRRAALAANVLTGFAIEHLLHTAW